MRTAFFPPKKANHDGDGNEDTKKKDLIGRTIAQHVRFITLYIS